MKKRFVFILFAIGLISSPGITQMATLDELGIVSKNWIHLIVAERGCWGEYPNAYTESLQPFFKNNKLIGYYCQVKPKGFIVLSLRKELAPVKAYSAYGYFDPLSQEDISFLIMEKMAMILDTIEKKLGPVETISKQNLTSILEIDYSDAWDNLLSITPAKSIKMEKPEDPAKDNYQEGDIILAGNNWHQHPPFNEECPIMGCSNANGRAVVGCVATAGAQIMYHWSWPPDWETADPFDWTDMQDVVTYSSPQATINAVAEIGFEVALAVGMSFGCDGSGAVMTNMENVFQINYRYSNDCSPAWRMYYTAFSWFEMLKAQFNLNRPVEYGITGHAIVGDGWQEIGSPVVKQYHMNWGWTATSNDAWYTLDELPDGGLEIEHVIRNIVPNVFLGGNISGTYSKMLFPFRYVDQDTWGASATFEAGQYIQFLENVEVTGTSSINYVTFNGLTNNNTRLFTGGDQSYGILIKNGNLRLGNNGSIKLQ
jgi:hypothetical protein